MQPQSVINQMLKNIPDSKARQMYGQLLNRKLTKRVLCLSRACGGRVIAYIDDKNNCHEEKPLLKQITVRPKKGKIPAIKTKKYVSGLSSSRLRLDGKWGFHCYCGNRSILAREEKGIIGMTPPTKRDLEEIASRLGRRREPVVASPAKVQEVDGFRVEDI